MRILQLDKLRVFIEIVIKGAVDLVEVVAEEELGADEASEGIVGTCCG